MSRPVNDPAPPRYVQAVAAMTDREVIAELTVALAASAFWRARVTLLVSAAMRNDSACCESPSQTDVQPGHQ